MDASEALRSAAQQGNPRQIEVLLRQQPPPDVNAPDPLGKTALHCAALMGNTDAISVLLGQPTINANARDANGCTPLYLACLFNHALAACTLIACTAKVDASIPNFNGVPPWDAEEGHWSINQPTQVTVMDALRRHQPQVLHSAVALAHEDREAAQAQARVAEAQRKRAETLRRLQAEEAGVGNSSAVVDITQQLFEAVRFGSVEGFEDWLRRHPAADLNLKTTSGRTAFMEACSLGHTALANRMLQEPQVWPNARDNSNRTGFYLACANRRYETVGMLLKWQDRLDPQIAGPKVNGVAQLPELAGDQAIRRLVVEGIRNKRGLIYARQLMESVPAQPAVAASSSAVSMDHQARVAAYANVRHDTSETLPPYPGLEGDELPAYSLEDRDI